MAKNRPTNQATCRHCHATIYLDRSTPFDDDKTFSKPHECPQGKHHRAIWESMKRVRERALERQ